MNQNSRISLVKKLKVTDMAGEKVMIDFDSGKYFLLKGVANDIWDLIQMPVTIGAIEEQLLSEYDIDQETCHNSLVEFIEKLAGYNFVEIA